MLSKNNRISKKDFPYILSKGKRHNSPHFFLYVAPFYEGKQQKTCISFSVPKKVAKLSSTRNKYRRRGYSAVRKQLKDIKLGFFLFFSLKKDISSLPHPLLEKEILELLKSSGVVS